MTHIPIPMSGLSQQVNELWQKEAEALTKGTAEGGVEEDHSHAYVTHASHMDKNMNARTHARPGH